MTPGNPKFHPSVPTNLAYGDMCRKGSYCPEQSTKMFACEPTKFMPYDHAVKADDCITCPNGKYCDVSGIWDLSGSTKDCQQGYYCETGAVNARQKDCKFDEKCVTGTLYPEQCTPE